MSLTLKKWRESIRPVWMTEELTDFFGAVAGQSRKMPLRVLNSAIEMA
jgi:hypothetical protein